MPEETNQLIDKIHSIPVVKELDQSCSALLKTLSDSNPMMKTFIDSISSMLTSLLGLISQYSSYTDPYASQCHEAIKGLEEKFPTMKKSSTEICQECSKQVMGQIPESVKETIKSSLNFIIQALLSAIKQVKGPGQIGSLKQIVDNALSSFNQVKTVTDYATSLAQNVSQNETAISAAKTSTDAILAQLGPEAKEKYEKLPDANAKAMFIAEESWKTVTNQLSTANEQILAKLPEPFKSGYTALISLINKVSNDLTQKLPSNSDVLSIINTSVDAATKYLESLQKMLSSSESEEL